jgi:probable HAF family extracellular repeat protein
MPLGVGQAYALRTNTDGAITVGHAGGVSARWKSLDFAGLVPASGLNSVATGLSDDGAVVVGYDQLGAWRWTSLGGVEYISGGVAWDTSSDGETVVGWHASRAFRWRPSTGSVFLVPLPGDSYSDAQGVSADGSVVVGSSRGTRSVAFRWTETAFGQPLGTLEGGLNSIAYAVSDDGNVAVGFSDSPTGQRAFRWTAAGGMENLGVLPGDTNSQAHGVSSDGSVVVGVSIDANAAGGPRYRAFVWTATTGMRELGPANGGCFTNAQSVSGDGRTIVGATWARPIGPPLAARWSFTCDIDFNRDFLINLDDLGDFITDYYTLPAIPGGAQPAATTYAGVDVGFGVPCVNAPDAPPPYSPGVYRASGYRVGYSPDGSNSCPLAPGQPFPNLDNLNDFITGYYTDTGLAC